jgi:hypothetical protein
LINEKNKRAFLNNVYVPYEKRGTGIFNSLYKKAETYCYDNFVEKIECVSTEKALPIYINKGFEMKKSFVNYFKLIKNLK